VGREDLLRDIDQAFSPILDDKNELPTSHALIGMGGIGKTQVVLEYCLWNKSKFHSIFWIHCHTEDSIISSLLKIAEEIGVPPELSTVEQKKERVFDAWSSWPGPCLIVYDNVDDPAIDIQSHLPQLGRLAILVTSRLRATAEVVDSSREVEVMSEREAISLLVARADLPKPKSASPEQTQASDIVKKLDCLPLALDIASAYIRQQKVTLKSFLERFDREKAAILKHIPTSWQYKDYGNPNEKERRLGVITTWELSLRLCKSSIGKIPVLEMY
jgi:hypothetical protein